MVDSANAGREKQPFRRVNGDGWIEDDGARHGEFMPEQFLHFRARVGDAGKRGELAARNCGGNADLAPGGRSQRRNEAIDGAEGIDAFEPTSVVSKAELN